MRLRDGLRLHVREGGVGHPILLLHGFTGSSAAWGEETVGSLSRNHRVLAVDLPGHGESDAPTSPAGWSMEAVVRDLVEVLDHLGVGRADWVGYSMGGRTALAAAVLAPQRVAHLVLESASPGIESEGERAGRRERDEALARSLEERGIDAFIDAWMAQPLFSTQRRLPPSLWRRERRRRLGNRPEALAACLRGMGTGTQPSFWERLDEVIAPVLLITGGEDTRFTQTAAAMERALPDAHHHIVPRVGHAVHLEAPASWLAAVSAFLEA